MRFIDFMKNRTVGFLRIVAWDNEKNVFIVRLSATSEINYKKDRIIELIKSNNPKLYNRIAKIYPEEVI